MLLLERKNICAHMLIRTTLVAFKSGSFCSFSRVTGPSVVEPRRVLVPGSRICCSIIQLALNRPGKYSNSQFGGTQQMLRALANAPMQSCWKLTSEQWKAMIPLQCAARRVDAFGILCFALQRVISYVICPRRVSHTDQPPRENFYKVFLMSGNIVR